MRHVGLIDPSVMIPAFLVALAATLFILSRLARIASRIGLVDYPYRRKKHETPKPIVGGVGMTAAVFLGSFLFVPLTTMSGFFAGTLTLVVVGSLDDCRELSHWWKFAAQAAAALMIVRWSTISLHTFGDILSFGPISFPDYSVPMTVFCIVGIANAFNMIDGLDGLAAGISLIVFSSFAVVSASGGAYDFVILSAVLSGALLGFLRYNWHPARLFMGDAGSLLLGFTAAFISIGVTQGEGSVVPPVVPLLILTVPVTDTLTVIVKRIVCGRSPFSADRRHLHHTLLRLGLSEKVCVSVILVLSFVFSSIGVAGMMLRVPEHHLFMIFLVYFFLYLGASFYTRQIVRSVLRRRREYASERRSPARANPDPVAQAVAIKSGHLGQESVNPLFR